MRKTVAVILLTILVMWTTFIVVIAEPFSFGPSKIDQIEFDRTITFDETEVVLFTNKTMQLKPIINRMNDDAPKKTSIVWESSDNAVAKVSQEGKVTALALGNVKITASAKDNDNITATVIIHVVLPVSKITAQEKEVTLLLNKNPANAEKDLHVVIEPTNAYYQEVIWSSSKESIVTVDKNGNIKGIAPGKATITATSTEPTANGTAAKKFSFNVTVIQAVQSISLSDTKLTLNKGKTNKIKVTVSPETATNKKLKWTTENKNIATVDQSGVITARATGKTTIHCEAQDGSGVKSSCNVTVLQMITSINATNKSLVVKVGENVRSNITISPKDATNKTLTWSSTNSNVATVNKSNGTITGVRVGECDVIAKTTDGSDKTITIKVKVESLLKAQEAYNMAKKLDAHYVKKNNRLVTCSTTYRPGDDFYLSYELFQSRGYGNRSYSTWITMGFDDAKKKSDVNPSISLEFYPYNGVEPNNVILTINNYDSITLPKSMWSWSYGNLRIRFRDHLDWIELLATRGGSVVWSNLYPSSLCAVDFGKSTPEYKALAEVWKIWKKAGLYDLFK